MTTVPADGTDRGANRRAQSNVVGVALLLGITVLSLAGLTAAVGTVVEHHAAEADATRVAAQLDDGLDPVETTGPRRIRVAFGSGRLETVRRDIRVLDSTGVRRRIRAGGLVYRNGDHRVAFAAGAVVRGRGAESSLVDPLSITATREAGGVLVVGAPRLNATGQAIAGTRGVTATLRTNVSHERTALGDDTYSVAVETDAPNAIERSFLRLNASVTRRDFDGDGVESVVGQFSGRRTAYLVVHDLDLEVTDG
jgi:hypothetical protein